MPELAVKPNMFADADTVESVIYQLAGAASVCWEDMSKTGVFQDDKARDTCEQALERLRELGVQW